MTGLYWDAPSVLLKTYSAQAKATGQSVLKIELDVREPYHLGRLLEDLAAIRTGQAKRLKGAPAAEVLQIEDMRATR